MSQENQETQEAKARSFVASPLFKFNDHVFSLNESFIRYQDRSVDTFNEAIDILKQCHDALDGCQKDNLSPQEFEGVRLLICGAATRIANMANLGGDLCKHIEALQKKKEPKPATESNP
jgi:hypothetical protein